MNDLWPAAWLETIDSTNEEAKRRAVAGQFGPIWIAAKEQTAGRGRRGRDWVSSTGNLYATALFEWTGQARDLTRVPFAAALAVSDAVMTLAPGSAPKLKWPNDVRIEGAKLSGILVEAGELDGRRWVAAGIGINVASAPENIGQETTCVAVLRGDTLVSADMALDALNTAFSTRLAQAVADFQPTRKTWLERADGLGQEVNINLGDTVTSGTFEDMAEDGALILRLPDGEQRLIRAGDVELIREVSTD